jgi:hypothetical protein
VDFFVVLAIDSVLDFQSIQMPDVPKIEHARLTKVGPLSTVELEKTLAGFDRPRLATGTAASSTPLLQMAIIIKAYA